LGKKKTKEAIKELKKSGVVIPDYVKSSCCKKYKKGKISFVKIAPSMTYSKKLLDF
jgi:hypothetical protein